MNRLKQLVKKAENETSQEEINELLRKIDSLILKKGIVHVWGGFAALYPLDIETRIISRDALEDGYFDSDSREYKWGYVVGDSCIYIQPEYTGIEIVLSMNEKCAVSCLLKMAYIRLHSGINAPNIDQKQIGEFFERVGVVRNECNICYFRMEDKVRTKIEP